MKVPGYGNPRAKIMIVGEAPGAEEERQRKPFVGASGQELTRMLHEAGIAFTDCYVTNVCKFRPPQNKIANFFLDKTCKQPNDLIKDGIRELEIEIQTVKPNVIIACGNTPLWALRNFPSGLPGVGKWRGSELPLADRLATRETLVGHSAVVIPTYHPAGVLRQWAWRNMVVHDLKARVKKYVDSPVLSPPEYNFILRPTASQALEYLERLHDHLNLTSPERVRISIDIETRQGHIACVGLATSSLHAICIPFLCVEDAAGYWSHAEEVAIILALRTVLEHPAASCVGQNFLYDIQYFAKYFGFLPRLHDDTMLMQHVAFPSVPKGLHILSSMYCRFHEYWKEEGKEWNPKIPEEQYWAYNCKDACVTFEVAGVLERVLAQYNLVPQYQFIMEVFYHILQPMLRGCRMDLNHRNHLAEELIHANAEREEWRTKVCGHPLNPASPKQMKAFFYDDLGMPKQYAKERTEDGLRKPTLDDEAVRAIAKKEPLLRELIRNIVETRSLRIFNSNFVQARLGEDNRLRCYFNPGGAETFRFSSSKDAFGSGANLQTIPSGAEGEIDPTELAQYNLPNVRKLFIPDEGCTIAEIDLAGADAQVVAWEAEDEELKAAFRAGFKIHVVNTKAMFGSTAGPDGRREPYYTRTKVGVHLTNYGGKPRTMAASLGISIHEAERFQKRWFEMHPAISKWHDRIQGELSTKRMVANKFGYRRLYFDRIEDLLPEALAWVPQSTVAITTNKAMVNLRPRFLNFTEQAAVADLVEETRLIKSRARLAALGVQLLLQVHDSLVFQYPTRNEDEILRLIHAVTRIKIPYADPLYIPWGLKTSTKSWGDAEGREWPETTPTGLRVL